MKVLNTERRRSVDSEAKVISFDEMWTYVNSRRKGKRNSVWIWTAVVEEEDGSRWMDYEVGDRGEETFLRLYKRLPDAKKYRSDDYNVYKWLPSRRHKVGKGGEVNRNEACILCSGANSIDWFGKRKGTQRAWRCFQHRWR